MYKAKNKDGCYVYIENAEKGQEYFCPLCGAPMIVKDGVQNAKHFAHKAGECTDTWHYDMSEWHLRMQSYFPLESREVVVKSGNKTHRADVLIDKTVIEFQHSPISVDEYMDRNRFFGSLGYSVAWVFDVSQQYEYDDLYYSSDDNNYLLTWKNPIRIFAYSPNPTDYNKNFSIWLYTGEIEEDDYIQKVIWCAKDDDGNPSFKRIILSEYPITLNESFDIKQFFMSKMDHFNEALRELQSQYKYTVRNSGIHGMPRDSYVCPKTGKFGLDLYKEHGCNNCIYCYMIAQKKRKDSKTETQVYCCYPNQVWEECETHSGYDYGRPPTYNI